MIQSSVKQETWGVIKSLSTQKFYDSGIIIGLDLERMLETK